MPEANVFLSWSGERSRLVAEALRDWLPQVVQAISPWLSSDDIAKGRRWDAAIAGQLDKCRVGIFCLTPENANAPWLHFEAGAISKTPDAYACTYLYNLTPAQVPNGPFASFQHTIAMDKKDTERLVATINASLREGQVMEAMLAKSFEKWWPDLEQTLRHIPPPDLPPQGATYIRRTDRDILEELLDLVRGQTVGLSDLVELLRQSGPRERAIGVPVLGSIRIDNDSAAGGAREVPVLGSIPQPDSFQHRDPEEVVRVTPDMVGDTRGIYALRVKGTSLIDELLNDGDLVIMRRTETANDGDLVAVWLKSEQQTTLGRYYEEGETVCLQTERSDTEPLIYARADVEIQGKVIAVIRHT